MLNCSKSPQDFILNQKFEEKIFIPVPPVPPACLSITLASWPEACDEDNLTYDHERQQY